MTTQDDDFAVHTFNIGWSSIELTKELQTRIDEAQKFLMQSPAKSNVHGKRTNSWKPIQRGKK